MTGISIRFALARDAAALTALIDRAYADAATRVPDLPAVSEGIAQDIAENTVFVAERDGAILGCLVLLLRGDHGLLANVAVDPDVRATGLGRRLIALAETFCRAQRLTVLRLSTHVLMPENLRFYQRLGWHETSRSGNRVTMEKPLID